MTEENFLKKVPEINVNREYWFVRTESGEFYDAFFEGNYIAIGWNEITTEEIKKSIEGDDLVRKKLVKLSEAEEQKNAKKAGREIDYKKVLDPYTQGGKSKISMIVNKLHIFYSLKEGDVVVIPNYGSSELAFGIIEDQRIYDDTKDIDGCYFRKRRKVNWVVKRDFSSLDKMFYNLKRSMHAVSSIKYELAEQIDRVMNDVYFKDGFGHYVVRVKKKEDIKALDLFELGSDLTRLLKLINDRYEYEEPVDETIVKINVQSNGDFLLKGKIGNSIVILGLAVGLIACGKTPPKLDPKSESDRQLFENIKNKADTLEIELINRK